MPQIPAKVQKPLERVVVKLCERLPADRTLFERDGFCQKPTDNCRYCEQVAKNDYLCNKKTYSPIAEVNRA